MKTFRPAHARTTKAARASLLAVVIALVASQFVVAQDKTKAHGDKTATAAAAQTPALKRTSTRKETRKLGYGGALTLYGAPNGSITVEGWTKSEVEIIADVEINANTEEELTQLAAVNSFVLDEDLNHLRIVTVGTHDRKYMKSKARNFPKKLLALPWKIDYHVRVPAMIDLEIYGGRGGVQIAGVEGSIRLNAGEGATELTLTGGDVEATLEGGPVRLHVPSRNWRGRGLSLRLASGDLTVELPSNYSGDINADILRTGRIENTLPGLAPRERTQATERSLQARMSNGGATLSFTVGDGTLRIKPETPADN
ncbi:MAG: hypothetical protein WCD76_05740 [Pyrinomonadaceae bacterium]